MPRAIKKPAGTATAHRKKPRKTNLRARLTQTLNDLPEDQLKSALDYLEYLQHRDDDATEELLRMPGMKEKIHRGLLDAASGKLIPLGALNRKRSDV